MFVIFQNEKKRSMEIDASLRGNLWMRILRMIERFESRLNASDTSKRFNQSKPNKDAVSAENTCCDAHGFCCTHDGQSFNLWIWHS